MKQLIAELVEERLAKRLAGKLLLKPELQLDNSTIDELLKQKKLQKYPAMRKGFLTIKCLRCSNDDPDFLGKIPCSKCKREHPYCRKCIQMGRVLACEFLYEWTGQSPTWRKHKYPCQWTGKLTTDQSRASKRLKQAVNKREELLLWAVTGAGKTEMTFASIEKALQKGLRICIATPRIDVVRELLPRFKEAFPNVAIEGLYGGSEDREGTAQLIIATTHQLLRFKQAFDFMIIDEIDAFPFNQDKTLRFAANRAVKGNSALAYLTATPRRKDIKRMKRKQLPHIFVPRRFHNYPLPVPKFKMSYNLKKFLKANELPPTFYEWFEKERKTNRQLLIFTPTIETAQKIANHTKLYFNQQQLKITYVHSADNDREEKVNKFRHQEISVLVTTTILERGVTFPSVDVVVIHAGHDVFDEAALVQISGRAGRSIDDPTGHVLFIHDGKTRAMVRARRAIERMNERASFS